MKITSFKTWTLAIACAFLTAPVYALSINDPGVVGTIDTSVGGNQNTSPPNELAWSNYLLSLANNTTITVDAPGDDSSNPEQYKTRTSGTDYSGVLSGGTQVNVPEGSPLPNVSGYQYILVKYDGPNAGYVLYHVADAGGTFAEFPSPIWGTGDQYRVSHVTGFGTNSVPDGGATLILLGAALGGLGAARRFMKS